MCFLERDVVKHQLTSFVAEFASILGRIERQYWCEIYLTGLLFGGQRKSIGQMAAHIKNANAEALQHFIKDSPWDYVKAQIRLLDLMEFRFKGQKRTDFILFETCFAKYGKSSVGVEWQRNELTGKIENCQKIITWNLIISNALIPVMGRLFLPRSWIKDKQRVNKAGVPKEALKQRERWQVAQDLFNKVNRDKIGTILCDPSFMDSKPFLCELDQCGKHFIGQIKGTEMFWPSEIQGSIPLKSSSRTRNKQKSPSLSINWCPKPAATLVKEKFLNHIKTKPLIEKSDNRTSFIAMRVSQLPGSKGPGFQETL